MKKHADSSPPTFIRFRLDPEIAEKLAAKAKLFGMSIHEFARESVTYMLQDGDRQQFQDALDRVREEFCKLRSDLRVAIVALLCDAGNVTREDAEDWVDQHLFLQ